MNTIGQFLTIFFLTVSGAVPVTTSLNNPVLKVQIEFGRGPHCDGRGTCSVVEDRTDSANAMFYFDGQGKLHLEIKKAAFPSAKLSQQFEDSLFQQSERFMIPQELMQKLQVDSSYQIKTGTYPIKQDSNRFEVIF